MLLCAECVLPMRTFVPLGPPAPGPLYPHDLWAEIQPLSSSLLLAAWTMGSWGTLGCPLPWLKAQRGPTRVAWKEGLGRARHPQDLILGIDSALRLP